MVKIKGMKGNKHVNLNPSEHLTQGKLSSHMGNVGKKVHHMRGVKASVPHLGKKVFNY